jgi:hypothetical protein
VAPEGLLREQQVTIDGDFEDSSLGRDDDQRRDRMLVFVQDLGRQTDGPVGISSLGAVFDADLHRPLRIAVLVTGLD